MHLEIRSGLADLNLATGTPVPKVPVAAEIQLEAAFALRTNRLLPFRLISSAPG
jgi:hypothetical protein